jgi:hypothetical protein
MQPSKRTWRRLVCAVAAPLFACGGGGNAGSGGGAVEPPDASNADGSIVGSHGDGGVDGGAVDASVRPVVAACDGLAAVGTFEQITPPLGPSPYGVEGGPAQETGTFAIAADPVNQGTLYAGTFGQGVWKSTDCGATWTDVATGRNGDVVSGGMNWTFGIDPTDPQTLYTNSGYGTQSNGLLKSTNGGVDWDIIWPPSAQPDLSAAFQYNFANVIAIDPSDHLHVLLTFHEQCLPPHAATCIAETEDGGGTWRLIDGNPTWTGNEGQVVFFLDGSTTWLWGSQTNGFWRTPDSGASWQAITGMTTSHLQSSQLARTSTGAFIVAGADDVWRSPDGTASTWQAIDGTGPVLGGIVVDGTSMYASTCYFPGFCTAPNGPRYLTSTDDGQTWTAMPTPPNVDMGGTFAFDPGHGVLYSSNDHAGLWRVRVR